MPLVRFPVRNEYGLGNPELYIDSEKEDPRAMLQGVAVAGLVGILRQLGDLAEFAAEVFHGLQEEVTVTSSRSRKIMVRVQRIEAALPSLEKSMLAQKSHLHFAYTRGSVWRAHPQIEQNHFIYGDLPEFIMDSYGECSDPPRLHLLDKFDSGGPGSCLKRYSDPTFFKKSSALSRELNGEKLSRSKKTSRSKKKRACQRIISSRDQSISNHTDRPQFASVQADVQTSLSPSQTVSTHDGTIKSDQEEQPNAFDLRTDSSYIECVFHPTGTIKPEEHEHEQVSFSSSPMLPDNSTFDLTSVDECTRDIDNDDLGQSPLQEQIRASSSSVSWEEKEEIVQPTVLQNELVQAAEILRTDFHGDSEEKEVNNDVGEMEFSVDNEGLFTSRSSQIRPDDLDSEPDNFMDALNTIESESETDTDFQTNFEVERSFNLDNDRAKDKFHGQMAHYSEDPPSNQTKQELERSFSFNNDRAKFDVASDQTKQEAEQSYNFSSDRTKDGIDEFVVNNSDIPSSILQSCSAAHGGSHEGPPFDNPSEDPPSNQTKQELERSFSFNNDRAKFDVASDQTKQEAEQSYNFSSDRTKDGIDEFAVDNPDIPSSILQSCSAAHGGSHEGPPFDNPISSQFHVHEELPKSAEESYALDISVNNRIDESLNTESLSNLSGPEEVNQHNLLSNEIQDASGECQKKSAGNSGVQSFQFWTNGGLLGLEPSKPPFGAPNTVNEGLVTRSKDGVKSSLAQSNGSNSGDVGKPEELIQRSEIIERNYSKCSTSYRDDSNAMSDKKTSWRFLSAVLDTKREKNGYFQLSNSFNNNLAHSFGRINGIVPKNEQKVSADGRALCSETSQGDMSNGSHISILNNRIPLNDFQTSLVNTQSRGYRALGDISFKGFKGSGSPMHSPSSSPPLQHMKISFQPANNLGTSKLKLKFPDGSFGHESGTYLLPSFQLVPEPTSSHHDIGSESDDTFCRSSPYMSDDRPGNESESDSELWDSDDNHQSKDNEAYDGIHNLSLKESVSASTDTEENRHESIDVDYGFQSSYAEKCSEPTQANLLTDLTILSAMNPLFEKEVKLLSDANNFTKLHLPEEHTPQPPPLPPSDWQNIKPNPNVTTAKQESNSEELNLGNDLKMLGSTIVPQSNPNLVKQQILSSIVTSLSNAKLVNKQQLETNKDVAFPPRRESEERRFSGQKEVNQIREGRMVDEKEDFLHQIRTQSFNLRRTGFMPEKANVTTGPITNARVAAILEKANAIRQDVGSDEWEDDDSWS